MTHWKTALALSEETCFYVRQSCKLLSEDDAGPKPVDTKIA